MSMYLSDLEVSLAVQGLRLDVRDAGWGSRHRLIHPNDEDIARDGFTVVDHDQIPYLDLFEDRKQKSFGAGQGANNQNRGKEGNASLQLISYCKRHENTLLAVQNYTNTFTEAYRISPVVNTD